MTTITSVSLTHCDTRDNVSLDLQNFCYMIYLRIYVIKYARGYSVLMLQFNWLKGSSVELSTFWYLYPRSPKGEGVYCFTSVRLSILPSVQNIFRRIFLSNWWWQKSDIWSQVSYRYTILWVAFLDPSDSYFLFVDFVDFYTHWTYMLIFRRIFLSNYWWQKSDIWSQASYRYPIL